LVGGARHHLGLERGSILPALALLVCVPAGDRRDFLQI
jgi:hypothetical protein